MNSPNTTRAIDETRRLHELRERDHIRYLGCLTAKQPDRMLYVCYALLHAELHSASDPKRDPIARHMRMEWWRSALQEAFDNKPRNHDLLQTFAALKQRYPDTLSFNIIDTLIDNATRFRDADIPQTYDAWKVCCAETSGTWALGVTSTIYPNIEHISNYVYAAAAVRGAVSCVFAVTGTHPNRRVLLPQEALDAYDLTETRIVERMRPKETLALLDDIYQYITTLATNEEHAFLALQRRERRRLYPVRILARTALQDISRAQKKRFPPGSGGSKSVALSIGALMFKDMMRRSPPT